MKNISEYIINEVSKGLAQKAYNKATGAQKNRLKKLYKEIYGDDVEKTTLDKIKFDFKLYADAFGGSSWELTIKNCFKEWPQHIIDKIKTIKVYTSNTRSETKIEIIIDNDKYWASFSDEDDILYVTNTNINNDDFKNEDIYGPHIFSVIIATIYESYYKEH